MTIQYNPPTYAPFPTELNRSVPVVTYTQPTQTIITSRDTMFAWTTNQPAAECVFKWSLEVEGGTIVIPWTLGWSSTASVPVNNIANGRYTFSVKAKNKFGVESVITTKSVEVRRELPVPVPQFPGISEGEKILPSASVTFRCSVPRGEDGERYDVAFQIKEETSANPLTTVFVDGKQWFDSYENTDGFSGIQVVGETGGEVTFTKVLQLRKRYWWKARLSVYRGGQRVFSAVSSEYRFTTGVLGTKLSLTANPSFIRADGVSAIIVQASVMDDNNQVDTQWAGVVNFSLLSGSAVFATPRNDVPVSAGIASVKVTDTTIEVVRVQGQSNYLLNGVVDLEFGGNRLPAAPTWLDTSFNPPEVLDSSTKLYVAIPQDLDNDRVHLKIEIDRLITFDSPWLKVAETKFDRTGWQYFNGAEVVPFPIDGVPQGVPGTYACYEVTGLVDSVHYFCRASATDSYER